MLLGATKLYEIICGYLLPLVSVIVEVVTVAVVVEIPAIIASSTLINVLVIKF